MAWGRKKSGGRKEPQFGHGASLASLRLSAQDRIPFANDDKPKKTVAKRKIEDDDDDDAPPPPPPRERKPRETARTSKRRGRARSGFGLSRLIYWGFVVALWGAIVVVGAVVWAGAHLPPIQSLEIP